jgi:hypothetical protein
MTTQGIEAIFVTTHNWGKAAKFFQALGYALDFDTGHNSGQLSNGGGPTIFIAEIPETKKTDARIVMKVADAAAFKADPIVEIVSPFAPTHWGTQEMTVRDPDGRSWNLQAPGKA